MARFKQATILSSLACGVLAASGLLACDEESLCWENGTAEYGSWVSTSAKQLARCDDYRVLVVHANGTDMLFLDKPVHSENGASAAANATMSFPEFNYYEASTGIETVSCKALGSAKLRIHGSAYSYHSETTFGFSIIVDMLNHSYVYEDSQPK